MQFILSGAAGERGKLVEALEDFCRVHHVPDAARNAADLALEEHLTNVLTHGFEPGATRFAVVRLSVLDDCLLVEVEDSGKAFDPLAAPPVDTSLPLEEKPIGGLGVHLMRQFMDELTYVRDGGKNVLRMKKRFRAA